MKIGDKVIIIGYPSGLENDLRFFQAIGLTGTITQIYYDSVDIRLSKVVCGFSIWTYNLKDIRLINEGSYIMSEVLLPDGTAVDSRFVTRDNKLQVGETVRIIDQARKEVSMIGCIIMKDPPPEFFKDDKGVQKRKDFKEYVVQIPNYTTDGYNGNPCFNSNELEAYGELYDPKTVIKMSSSVTELVCPVNNKIKHVSKCVSCDHFNMVIDQNNISCFKKGELADGVTH